MDAEQAQNRVAERANTYRQIRADILSHGVNGLILISGAGATALVAWMQAAWGEQSMRGLLLWQLAGACILLLGTAVASTIFALRYWQSIWEELAGLQGPPHALAAERTLWRWQVRLTATSISCFLIGLSVAIAGAFANMPP